MGDTRNRGPEDSGKPGFQKPRSCGREKSRTAGIDVSRNRENAQSESRLVQESWESGDRETQESRTRGTEESRNRRIRGPGGRGIQESGKPGVGGPRNPGIEEPTNPGIRKSKKTGTEESGNPGIEDSGNRGIRESRNPRIEEFRNRGIQGSRNPRIRRRQFLRGIRNFADNKKTSAQEMGNDAPRFPSAAEKPPGSGTRIAGRASAPVNAVGFFRHRRGHALTFVDSARSQLISAQPKGASEIINRCLLGLRGSRSSGTDGRTIGFPGRRH